MGVISIDKILGCGETKDATNNNLIALCGERRRGKDHFTKHLVEKFGAVRLSFSDEVRRLADDIFPWLDSFNIDESLKDTPLKSIYNPNNLTPRDIWKLVGKVRDVHPQFFVKRFLENQYRQVIQSPNTLFIITDLRTPDEIDYFIKPFSVPTLKIISPTADGIYEHDPFETFIKEYETDELFVNHMNGNDEFDVYFKQVAEKYKLQGVKHA